MYFLKLEKSSGCSTSANDSFGGYFCSMDKLKSFFIRCRYTLLVQPTENKKDYVFQSLEKLDFFCE